MSQISMLIDIIIKARTIRETLHFTYKVSMIHNIHATNIISSQGYYF